MKILLLAFLLSAQIFAANPYTYRVDTASTNMAATFPAGPQLAGPPNYIASIDVANSTSSEIELNCSSTSVPSANAVTSIYIPATSTYSSPVNQLVPYPFQKLCWARSVSGTISSGVFEIVAWGY